MNPSSTDWFDPEQRLALVEHVGVAEYNRLHAEFRQQSVIETINGHAIRPVRSMRFGQLYAVGDTGRAFSRLQQAEDYARYEAKQPERY